MLTNLLKSDKYMRQGRVLDMLKVTQQMNPDMTVHVTQGTVIYNNTIINIEEQDTTVLSAPNVGHWLVALSVDEHGTLVYTYGIQSTDVQTFPRLPNDCLHLALIDIGAADEHIINEQIYDLRTFFNFSSDNTDTCQVRCCSSLSEDDQKLIDDYANKFEELSQEVAALKLLLQPQQEYTVLTDSRLQYKIRFKDDGTPYYTQVGSDVLDDNTETTDSPTKDYHFDVTSVKLNVVVPDSEGYVPFTVKVRSLNAFNESIHATILINSFDSRIFSENYTPQYRENEFIIDNIQLTRSGFVEHMAFNFHTFGTHIVKLKLYDKDTSELLDEASVEMNISMIDNDSVI